MGCTKSKLDDNVCLKDETEDMHKSFISQHGLANYYSTMGMPPTGTEMTDKSDNLNIGFINVEEKTSVENKFYGLGPSDILEVCLGILFFLYISKMIYKRIKKRKQEARASKNMEMKEIVQEAAKTQVTPPPPSYSFPQSTPMTKTPMQYAITKMHENPKALVPIFADHLFD